MSIKSRLYAMLTDITFKRKQQDMSISTAITGACYKNAIHTQMSVAGGQKKKIYIYKIYYII